MTSRTRTPLVVAALLALLPACDLLDPTGGSSGTPGDVGDASGEVGTQSLTELENELLALINAERATAGLPALQRDAGLDTIMRWFGQDILGTLRLEHTDTNGRAAEERVWYYGADSTVRCSEILNWWGDTPQAQVHYDAYRNSPPHHDAYMEQGIMDLGGAEHAGVFALSGTGPAGSPYEGRPGSYSGVVMCDRGVTLVIDPFGTGSVDSGEDVDGGDPAPDAGD